jgi:hypothetical protein
LVALEPEPYLRERAEAAAREAAVTVTARVGVAHPLNPHVVGAAVAPA